MLRWLLRVLIGPAEQPHNAPEPLEAQVVVLRSRLDTLETDWHDVLDKINRWAARENARKRRATARSLDEASQQDATPGEIVAPGGSGEAGMTRKGQLRARVAQLHARG